MMNKTFQTTLLVFFIIASFFLGFFVSKKLDSSGISKMIPRSYEEGWDDAEKRMVELGLISERKNTEIKSFAGVVRTVEKDALEIKIQPLNPFSNSDLDYRMVKINNKTKIFKIIKKNSEKYKEELEEFSKNNEKVFTSATGGGPSIYYKTEITLSEIKKGDKLSVKSDDNILDKKEFLASEITVSE